MAEAFAIDSPFPPAEPAAWRALVAKSLGEAPFESLARQTTEALPIAPLYAADETPQRSVPMRPYDAERPWDVRTLTAHPDAYAANAEILRDLEGGAASVVVRLDPTGERGLAAGSAEGLGRALQNVILEFALVGLDAGFLGPKAADWLGAVAKASPAAKLAFHLDPLSAFAEAGASPGPIEAHLVSAATVAARLIETYPQAQAFLASGRVVHEAGGGEAAEIAFAVAVALAYAKAEVRAGIPVTQAFARITLGLAADADYFVTIAKLRAARLVWARLASACGADPAARLEVRSSRRMLTVKDAWSNMIRLTAASFAAAVGGADAVVLGNFTDAVGLPTAFARRQSRNIQLVLMEEAHVGRVLDPAAGSGYIEALTDQIARAAWTTFQTIEARGGVIAALESGLIAREIQQANAARGELKILGVNAFPPQTETPVEVERPTAKPVEAPSVRLPGPDSRCPPLAPVRLSEAFEAGQ